MNYPQTKEGLLNALAGNWSSEDEKISFTIIGNKFKNVTGIILANSVPVDESSFDVSLIGEKWEFGQGNVFGVSENQLGKRGIFEDIQQDYFTVSHLPATEPRYFQRYNRAT